MNLGPGNSRILTLGLDLGQRVDYTALAAIWSEPERDPVTQAPWGPWHHTVVYLERLRQHTEYAAIPEWIRRVLSRNNFTGRGTLVVDATGVGAPVVETLRRARLGLTILPVSITAGEAVTASDNGYHVPRLELLTALAQAIQSKNLLVSKGVGAAGSLFEEMANLRRTLTDGRVRITTQTHDDLVLSTALAWWWTHRNHKPMAAQRPLPVGW